MVGIAASPSVDQEKYLPEELLYLPTFGQFYGSKSTLNMESLIEAEPQLIFDLGDKKVTVKADMDSIGKQTGIPALFYDETLEHMADTYRTLGKLLGREERGEEIAEFIDRTVDMAERNSAKNFYNLNKNFTNNEDRERFRSSPVIIINNASE